MDEDKSISIPTEIINDFRLLPLFPHIQNSLHDCGGNISGKHLPNNGVCKNCKNCGKDTHFSCCGMTSQSILPFL